MAEHKYELEYVFINLSDNDFNFAMCDFAESLIRMFERGDFAVEKCKDNVKEAFPKMMACLFYLEEYKAGKHEELKRYEDYFRNQATYLFDFDEIKGYMKEHALLVGKNGFVFIDGDDYRQRCPKYWLSNLESSINANAETILIQFVSTKNGKPVNGKSSYRIF